MTTIYKRRVRRYLPLLLGMLCLCLLISCGKTGDTLPGDTDPDTQTATDTPTETTLDSVTEPSTEPLTGSLTEPTTAPATAPATDPVADSMTEPLTDSTTDPATEPVTDPITEPVTESETEPETQFFPDSSNTSDVVRFDGESILSFLKPTGGQIELYEDADAGTVLKVTTSAPVNYIVLDYEAYMTAKGLSPVSVEDYRFAAVTLKTGAAYGDTHTSSSLNLDCAAGVVETCKPSNSSTSAYDAKATEWQTVLVDLHAAEWSGTLHNLLVSGAYKTRDRDYYCISSISFVNTVSLDMMCPPLQTEVSVKGLTEAFTVLQITDLHACVYTEEEIASMSAARYADLQGRWGLFWGNSPFRPDDILTSVGQYAAAIDADLILATGDMIDFPSEGNLALLSQFVTTSSTPVLYMAGNHDWTYSDDYMTQNAINTYLPRITALAGAVDGVAVYETAQITFITIDNSPDTISSTTLEAYLAAITAARAKGNAVVLSLHVPFTADTLVADCKRVWNRNICIGTGGISAGHEPTMALFRAVTEGTEYAPDAVISGHLHFSHEDVFPNGVPQIITANASGNGLCRVIRFVPA